MELVTLAEIVLNRVGSATGGSPTKEVRRTIEVQDEQPQTIKDAVVTLAEAYGELRGGLKAMWQEGSWNHASQPGEIVFNIHGANTTYGYPYASCLAYPALKVGDRYFKLQEVKV